MNLYKALFDIDDCLAIGEIIRISDKIDFDKYTTQLSIEHQNGHSTIVVHYFSEKPLIDDSELVHSYN